MFGFCQAKHRNEKANEKKRQAREYIHIFGMHLDRPNNFMHTTTFALCLCVNDLYVTFVTSRIILLLERARKPQFRVLLHHRHQHCRIVRRFCLRWHGIHIFLSSIHSVRLQCLCLLLYYAPYTHYNTSNKRFLVVGLLVGKAQIHAS